NLFVSEGVDIHRDGTELPFEAHAKAITIQDQRLMVTVLRDATERNSYIRELQQQKADIEQFTYAISHDLKSPLITIEGFAEILSDNLKNNRLDEADSDLQRITRAAGKMHVLLTELLEYSRLGVTVIKTEQVSMTEVIEDAMERVAGQIVRSAATLTITPDLPTVKGNAGRLAQLYQNLIDNAIKFNVDNTNINIELGWDSKQKCFFIDDNGPGIALEFQDKVFGLFDQLDPQHRGSGIGLATAKRIVETHGGKIWVQSPSHLGGTCFCFTLPGN
ncbi:MAG: HAMP domain-containing histidine kinase, partial [Immundisolibacteraceae bacterium]|nr:HAMP domain-containing histidine kinase [Immundisolibacteraceae bacterium]